MREGFLWAVANFAVGALFAIVILLLQKAFA
jgi:hypothetical protein